MSGKLTITAMLVVLSVLVLLTGCSGGGGSQTGSLVSSESPEAAVTKIFDSWRAGSAPVFALNAEGNISAQTTASETRYIRFRDLSGNSFDLAFTGVEYITTILARVNTLYYYGGNSAFGGLKISFIMAKESDGWVLEGLEILELPVVVVEQSGIKGVITDKVTGQPVAGARVEAYNQSNGVIAGYAVTDSTGFYQILELPYATYYLVVNRTGYEPYTISGISVN